MNEVVPEPKGNWGKTTCSLLIAPVALFYPQIAENSTTVIECKAGLFYLTYAPVLMNQVHSLLLWCINNNQSHSRCLLKRNEALNFCRRTFATPWGTTWTAVAAQSPDGAATGEVCWALMYLRSARSLSLSGIKKTNSQATVAWRYSRSKKSTRRHTTWKPVSGLDAFQNSIRGDRLETVEVGIRAHSGKYTAEPALQLLATR